MTRYVIRSECTASRIILWFNDGTFEKVWERGHASKLKVLPRFSSLRRVRH